MIIAPWGLTIKPGATYKYEIPPFANLKISNAALGAVLEDERSRTTLIIETEDRPPADSEDEEELDEDKPQLTKIVLTSLTPGKIEQSIHDITFSFPALLKINAIGKNTIHLGGNLVAEPETDESDSEDGYLDGVDAGDLDELNSDIDVGPDDIELSTDGDRFEELDETPQAKAGQKRRREDDMDEDEDEAKEAALTKSQKKKLNKKLKAQNGEAVPVGAPSTDKKERGTEKEKDKGPESSPEASKKEGKEKKKKHKKEEKEIKKGEKTEVKETKQEQIASTSAGSSSNKKTLAGGLVIEDPKVGTGKTAKAGSVCAMRYIGRLSNGTIFDSNTKGKPFTFQLGSGKVIKGWDQGIGGMQEGGERVITVPPALAYGNKKMPGIPPNSVLQFEVKLLSIK